MKSKVYLPTIKITFRSHYHIFSCILSFNEIEDVSTKFSTIQWFRLILCGTIVQWPNSTQTKHADFPQFHRDVRQRNPVNCIIIIHCIACTAVCHNRIWFKRTNKANGFGRQLPFIPPSLNDLNLPPNSFNILTTMATANPTEEGHDENYSPQSPEPP